ncbi:MFS transporter [Pseudomonas typographi]|uniref:MFS transporter n=1 Tax=Pseudomonas typographi TaxID=2715964 RepID=A0ABR7Z4S7_9PSED|nr:MFS transporter [Pseudomonas typographi]MBD1553963.1 MFS transporter [Pseudomonas typographi]MBD1588042.1 MFS transporter [Pseudomonas typographi]MBD1600404.1 MFS transporter [Pseudomonas typographi]
MTENDYLIAWGIYAFAALGCLLVWFRLTRWMWRWLREPLRLLAAVAVCTPTAVDSSSAKLAPAIAIAALDILFKDTSHLWQTAPILAMYAAIAMAAYLLFALVRWPLERHSRARRAEQARQAPNQGDESPRPAPEPEAALRAPPASPPGRVEPRV